MPNHHACIAFAVGNGQFWVPPSEWDRKPSVQQTTHVTRNIDVLNERQFMNFMSHFMVTKIFHFQPQKYSTRVVCVPRHVWYDHTHYTQLSKLMTRSLKLQISLLRSSLVNTAFMVHFHEDVCRFPLRIYNFNCIIANVRRSLDNFNLNNIFSCFVINAIVWRCQF